MNASDFFFCLTVGFKRILWVRALYEDQKAKIKKIKRLLPPWITSHLNNKKLGMILHAVIA